ncbi:MAG: RNA methyltransferase [Candidatus Binatus sp.]|uniref:RNA methyltransferase n=1 Tax=Candidatus Binatus sp. TaxID=2811406 RepID=UPI002724D1D4|nr:RNA methyltransferase [Candidatus Binatus sp.]MDO8433098.1 RNA methyltransferase [Candidatus Binatus sp.]
MADLFVALIHHPVVNRNGEIVTSAITSLDIHDIARAARTYDVRGVFIVHPIPEQRNFAASVIEHWRFDFGRAHDSRRREALELVQIVADLDEAISAAEKAARKRPLIVHTSAQTVGGASYASLRERMSQPDAPPMMLLLGTGFGMAPEVAARADIVLAPILGPTDYNHLSVRSAAGIILDRLRGH